MTPAVQTLHVPFPLSDTQISLLYRTSSLIFFHLRVQTLEQIDFITSILHSLVETSKFVLRWFLYSVYRTLSHSAVFRQITSEHKPGFHSYTLSQKNYQKNYHRADDDSSRNRITPPVMILRMKILATLARPWCIKRQITACIKQKN